MDMEEIQFTRLPTKLIFVLDSDLLKMLSILIQQESYWIEHKKIGKDGSFYKPIKEFADSFRKKNLQDIRLILQTLQAAGFIHIISSKGGKQANYYRICWDKIATYNDMKIPQLIQSPMIRTAKRTSKKKIEDSTISYQQKENDSTVSYHQDSELIVQDCTTTIDNIINKNNNITIDNSVITKSPLYDEYKKRIEELLADYQQESDYIVALDKRSNIEGILELAQKHIPMSEIEDYHSQLSEASTMHDRAGWNITLDKITKEMMEKYHTTNIHNVKSPLNSQQFKCVVNDLLDKADFYIDSEHWGELADNVEKWITHQWERDIISYDLQQETIEKVYNKLAS
jgi:hypothetical protein